MLFVGSKCSSVRYEAIKKLSRWANTRCRQHFFSHALTSISGCVTITCCWGSRNLALLKRNKDLIATKVLKKCLFSCKDFHHLFDHCSVIATICFAALCIREEFQNKAKYLDITFTFNIYFGISSKEATKILTGWWKDVFQIFETSWKEGTAAKELIKMITDWWKDVFQIFGTSWMLQGFVVLVNENIWEIFALWRGPLLF